MGAPLPLPRPRGEDVASEAGGHFVIIDEAFGETAPEFSVLDGQDLPANIIVLRSIGKFFGLAGLRVGFIICARPIADALRSIIGAWPIGGAQAVIAAAALSDAGWVEATRNRLQSDSQRLASLLARHGVRQSAEHRFSCWPRPASGWRSGWRGRVSLSARLTTAPADSVSDFQQMMRSSRGLRRR